MKLNFLKPFFTTLLSSAIGIILGIYLTSYHERRQLLKAKESALIQVGEEITSNEEILRPFYDSLSTTYKSVEYVFTNLNEELELIIHKDSLESFIENSKPIFEYQGSTEESEDSLNIEGQLELNYNSKLLITDLSQINWNSYKQTNFMSVTNFKCMTLMEDMYILQGKVDQGNSEWMDLFVNFYSLVAKKDRLQEFMIFWRTLLLKQKALLNMYENHQQILETCNKI